MLQVNGQLILVAFCITFLYRDNITSCQTPYKNKRLSITSTGSEVYPMKYICGFVVLSIVLILPVFSTFLWYIHPQFDGILPKGPYPQCLRRPFWQDILELLGLLHKKVTVKDFSKIGHYQTTTTKRKTLCILEAWNTELEEIFGYPDKEG